jgi:septum formation inhibitor MinC
MGRLYRKELEGPRKISLGNFRKGANAFSVEYAPISPEKFSRRNQSRGVPRMQCRQYNVKVFEIGLEDPRSFLSFLEANRALLAHHLLSIHGEEDAEVLEYLEEHGFHYLFNTPLPPAKRGVEKFRMLVREEEGSLPREVSEALERLKDLQEPVDAEAATASEGKETVLADAESEEREPPLKIVRHPLRSGQFVEYGGSVLLTERMNSGAKVAALGSVIALGVVEGDISSSGECVIVPPMSRGTLLFHGTKVESVLLKYPLNKISFAGETIQIQPIKKKEFH